MQNLSRNDNNDYFLGIDEEEEDTQANRFMTFRIGSESFGIGIRNIREIIELQKISEVPDMPDFVKGVINLRGKVIPVIDLRLRFKLEARAYDDRTCIIISEIRDSTIGFIVDSVEEVCEIVGSNIDPSPNFKNASAGEKYISGIGKINETVKILLDVEKLLNKENLDTIKVNPGAAPAAQGI